jgi:hypothetical protein
VITRILALFVVLAIAALPVGARAAIILNGSFETDALSPWVQDQGSGNWSITSGHAQSGSYSASDQGNAELKQSFTPVPDSTIASLSFWLEHPAAGVTTNAVVFYYSDGTTAVNDVTTTNMSFDFFDVTSLLNASKSLDAIGIWGTSSGVTYLDTVSLTLGTTSLPEVPALLMLAGPLVVVGVLRRR